uniref:Uncharacterized protein n=1 Tax=Pararge aegeria TaxID=116150 RepID=S4NWS1_9NEOP
MPCGDGRSEYFFYHRSSSHGCRTRRLTEFKRTTISSVLCYCYHLPRSRTRLPEQPDYGQTLPPLEAFSPAEDCYWLLIKKCVTNKQF